VTTILGLSAYYHDSAACLLRDGELVAAAQEERFTRIRHDADFPARAVAYCLREGGLRIAEVDHVVFYDKPIPKFARILQSHVAVAPRGLRAFLMAIPVWLRQKLWTARELEEALGDDREVLFTEHHQAHAASAFFPSPFESAAVLTIDGVGEWATTTCGVGNGNTLSLEQELRFPHSLGLLYSAFTYYTGFKVNSGEYKVMGLAPYGTPRFADLIRKELIDLRDDGSFQLNLAYFDYVGGLRMTNERFHRLFGGPPRDPESHLTEREMDLAASIQVVTEEVVLALARALQQRTGEKRLCLAGGVALNCVANGKLTRNTAFEQIFVQPAAGDAGGALGAAYAVWHTYLGQPRSADGVRDRMRGAYLGPSFTGAEIDAALAEFGAVSEVLDDSVLLPRVVERLERGSVVGWFSGRMEFGPRALGARSILGDPRNVTMQKTMNLAVKFRESFRPFAPSVREEDAAKWFELDQASPYMLLTAQVRAEHMATLGEEDRQKTGIDLLNVPRSSIPSVTHVDGSARVQTVSKDTAPRYHALLTAFGEKTGCGMLVNTSFNVRGEPIVCTPREAYICFMRTGLDTLVIEDRLFDKAAQPAWSEADWRSKIAAD
jgi:carbamoyltransferase